MTTADLAKYGLKDGDVLMFTSGNDFGCIALQREDGGTFYCDELSCSRFGTDGEIVTAEVIGNIYS